MVPSQPPDKQQFYPQQQAEENIFDSNGLPPYSMSRQTISDPKVIQPRTQQTEHTLAQSRDINIHKNTLLKTQKNNQGDQISASFNVSQPLQRKETKRISSCNQNRCQKIKQLSKKQQNDLFKIQDQQLIKKYPQIWNKRVLKSKIKIDVQDQGIQSSEFYKPFEQKIVQSKIDRGFKPFQMKKPFLNSTENHLKGSHTIQDVDDLQQINQQQIIDMKIMQLKIERWILPEKQDKSIIDINQCSQLSSYSQSSLEIIWTNESQENMPAKKSLENIIKVYPL